ncbi:MAG: TlyA family rRNA (cytidine-2'-O)-methyltransferase [Rhodospirillaceae bacterium]|nr:TlyA family rRNA (cytidine-2'-O)-methyltransferase [Rhodospirillaceae bacterium]|tara:strand:- start:855 stop:1598 length:744 start_codon:yes stop_codon:yes gene_type:complete
MNEKRVRLDRLAVSKGLVKSRTYAKDLIVAGHILCNGRIVRKASALVPDESKLVLLKKCTAWVSRGGAKLAGVLEHFQVQPYGNCCLDIGASTGGFTEVLLRNGAEKVYAVDVGHSQLAESIACNSKVVNLEGVDARNLNSIMIPDAIDILVCDVSFISLRKVIQPSMDLVKPGGKLVCLLKPQFEVGPGTIGRTGVLTDPVVRNKVLVQIQTWFSKIPNWQFLGTMESPLAGRGGNKEFFLGALKV